MSSLSFQRLNLMLSSFHCFEPPFKATPMSGARQQGRPGQHGGHILGAIRKTSSVSLCCFSFRVFVGKPQQKGESSDNFCRRELWMPHQGPLPLRQTEARRRKCNKDVASDVCLSCSSCPWAGADVWHVRGNRAVVVG